MEALNVFVRENLFIFVFVIILLQVITIISAQGKKETKREPKQQGRQGGQGHDRKDNADRNRQQQHGHRKPHDQKDGGKPREQGRPREQNRPQHSSNVAAIDPMEMSLRDINQRLKNAEREQENARRKMQENEQGGQQQNRQQRPPIQRSGNDRPPRREFNQGGQGGQGGQIPRREFSNAQQPRNDERPMQAQPMNAPNHAQNNFAPPPPQMQANNFAPPAPEQNGNLEMNGDVVHGRRFTAKRRQLPDTNAENIDAPPMPSVQENPTEFGR